MTQLTGTVETHIGHTPIVQLRRVVTPDMADVFVKLEGQNPGGSIKDRTALGLVEDAERRGLLKPGGTIVEPTSGNTGIGLAQVAAAKGYKLILCMPAQMSEERKRTLRAYGAELVLTDPERRMLAAIEEAEKIAQETGAVMMGQFTNPANPKIHRETTAREILEQTGGDIDVFVAGIGTGGTLTGVGQVLRQEKPGVKIYGVEPSESPLLSEGQAAPHKIQGLGPNVVPEILDQGIWDELLHIESDVAITYARRAAAEEGLLVGISSGAALAAASELARRPEFEGKTIVTVLPDTGERYLSTPLFEGLVD